MKATAPILVLILVLSSCMVSEEVASNGNYQKRKYTKGLHKVSTTTRETPVPKSDYTALNRKLIKALRKSHDSDSKPGEMVAFQENIESVSHGLSAYQESKSLSSKSIWIDEKCDLLTLTSGELIEVKVLEIGEKEIKYKKCSYLEGPTYSVSKSKVSSLRYPNGEIETFEEESYYSTQPELQEEKAPETPHHTSLKVQPMAIVSLVAALGGIIVAGIILGITAVVLGISAIAKIAKDPDIWKGTGMAVAGILIGALDVILVMAFLSTL